MHTESVGPKSTNELGGVVLAFSTLTHVGVDTRHTPYPGHRPMASFDNARPTAESSPATMQTMMCAISALIHAVHCALSGESDHARQYLGEAFRSLDREPTDIGGEMAVTDPSPVDRCRGGLAPWQIRHVSTHIEEHLSETIQCDDLARLVRLSLSHFMRAFRDSFGCPPHTYLMKRRLEHAQGLMLTTDRALGHIALECGLADQSHLSRLFQKFVGESPAAWRRARATAAATDSRMIVRSPR